MFWSRVTHAHRHNALAVKPHDVLEPRHLRLLHRQLLPDGAGLDRQPLALDLEARGQLLRPLLGGLSLRRGHEIALHQLVGRIGVALRLQVLGARRRHDRLLVEASRLECGAEGDELGLGGRQLPLGLEQLELDVWIAELQQDGARFHPGARIEVAPLHAAGSHCGHPADLLGDERAGATHLAQHGAAPHDVDEHGGAIHRGGGRLDPEHGDRHERNGREGAGAVHVLPLPLAPRRAWNVQAALLPRSRRDTSSH
jgi:hypothetical protein